MGKAVKAFGTAVLVTAAIVATGGSAAFALAAGTAVAITVAAQPDAIRAAGDATEFSYKTDSGIPIPFGRVPYAGDVNYRVAYDATNRYQSIFATLAGSGPIRSIVSFAGDDELTSFDANNKATNGAHEGFLWVKTLLGDQPQAALTSPTGTGAGIPAPNWGADHKQSGRAVYCMTMFENSKLTEYEGGILKPLFILEGVYGWDPRLDSTWPGGSGSCDIEDPSTWVWIDNPAIAALNWVVGRWEGLSASYSPDRYGVPYDRSLVAGLGASLDGIDVAAFMNAANVADTNGWTVAAIPTSKDDKYEVLTNLLQAAGAEPSRKAGRISCVAFAEEVASVLSVTAADTAGPIQISLGQSRLDRRNTVIPSYWSEDHNWEMVALDPVTDSGWLSEDGGSLRSTALALPYVPEPDQAAQLAYYHLANAREPISGTVPFKPHMRRIEPGDCFTFTEPGFLLDGIKVKCLRRSYDPMAGVVRITFRQETDAKHAAAMGETGTAPGPTVPDTPYPGPWPGDDAVYGPPGSGGGTAGGLAFLDTVSATEIADGAVEAGKLADNAVDLSSEKVTGKSLANVDSAAAMKLAGVEEGATENLGALADLNTVGAAQIDSAAVTAAKIGTSAVETVKINAAAVTNSLDVFTASVQTLNTSVQNVQGLTFTTTGNRLIIDFRFYLNIWHPSGGGETCTLVLKRDATTIWSIALAATGDDFLFGWQSVAVPDTPAAGSYLYQLTAQLSAGTGSVMTTESRFMSITEYKR